MEHVLPLDVLARAWPSIMIVSSDDRWVVGGGVNTEPNVIWMLNTASGLIDRHSFTDGRWVRLFAGRNDYFASARYGDDLIELAAYRFEGGVSEPVARIRIEPNGSTSLGDASAWAHVPRAYAGFRPHPSDGPSTTGAAMLVIDREQGTVEIDDLEWFQKGDYDRDYQAPGDPVEAPGSNQLLIPVVRTSRPLLYDLTLRRVVGQLELVSSGRVSHVQVGPQPGVIWAWGDELVRVRAGDSGPLDEQHLVAKDRLESIFVAPGPIADLAFDPAGVQGVLGILHTGEILLLDPQSLNVSRYLQTGFVWPEVAILSNGRVIVRDADTGAVHGLS